MWLKVRAAYINIGRVRYSFYNQVMSVTVLSTRVSRYHIAVNHLDKTSIHQWTPKAKTTFDKSTSPDKDIKMYFRQS